MYSERFQRNVWITNHARLMMEERSVPELLLLDLLETGNIKEKTARDLWIYKAYPERPDNLVCTAVMKGQAIIIKTVMVNWQLEE